jgi:hypothetical protein
MILAEVGDFSRFDLPDKLLAYAGFHHLPTSPASLPTAMPTWRSAVPDICVMPFSMLPRYVCQWDPTFAAYLAKKRAEGKHYNVAISHAAKKLVRLPSIALAPMSTAFECRLSRAAVGQKKS